MTIVCIYCGYASHVMQEAARHDADRPESCLRSRQHWHPRFRDSVEHVRETLGNLTL